MTRPIFSLFLSSVCLLALCAPDTAIAQAADAPPSEDGEPTYTVDEVTAAQYALMEDLGAALEAIATGEIDLPNGPGGVPVWFSGAGPAPPAASGATPDSSVSNAEVIDAYTQLGDALRALAETPVEIGPDGPGGVPVWFSGAGGGGGAEGGGASGGSGGASAQPPITYVPTWVTARPWIVAELPPAQPAPQQTPAPEPQIIRPRLPSGPGYPTAQRPDAQTSVPAPQSNIPAPSTFDPRAQTWAQYPSPDEWRTMTDAERMTAILEASRTRGQDPNQWTSQQWVEALAQFNERYGFGANPVSWPSASDWRGMNENQRIEMMRNMIIQTGVDPAAVTADLARAWLAYYNVDSYYSAEYQQYLAQQTAFDAGDIQGYLDLGGTLTTVALEAIYEDGYDPFVPGSTVSFGMSSAGAQQPPIPWYSLSAAGTSLSAAGNSLSLAGSMGPSSVGSTPAIDWYSQSAVGNSLALDWGGGLSSVGNSLSLAGGFTSLNGAFGTPVTLAGAGPGAWRPTRPQTIADPTGALSRFTQGGQLVGFLSDLTQDELIRVLTQNGGAGLDRLLAQPFNVLLTWGSGAFDIDLHMTGPNGSGDRFHIYYAAPGSLTSFPFAQLIRDCICSSGSEVILTTQLIQGGVYRISAFNFGDQSPTSTNLSSQGQLQLMIVRGGTAVSVGNGTTIQGGRILFNGAPTAGQAGNTWVAVEIDPTTGQIRFVDQITNSGGSTGVSAPISPQGLQAPPSIPSATSPTLFPATERLPRREAPSRNRNVDHAH